MNITLDINSQYPVDSQPDVRALMKLVGLKEATNTPASGYAVSVFTLIELFAALRTNQKIKAIKSVRDMTGLGLTEAKNFVEDNYFGPPPSFSGY